MATIYMGKRIRHIIREAVSVETDRYKKDNLLLAKHYMAEQLRMNEIDESIRYARRLQSALFPSEETLSSLTGESFLFSQPRDMLNGDFCWCTRIGSKVVLAVADCTGHGIPGALMSVLGLSLLNQVVLEERTYNPSHILRRIDEKMRVSFHHAEFSSRNSFDGMDISLCTIDYSAKQIQFAGAMRPLWIFSKDKLTEIKGSRYPIGGMRLEENRNYAMTEIDFNAGDFLYLFTDGFTDQFGGVENKKVTRARLRQLIELIHQLPAEKQKEQFMEFFLLWKGDHEQTDDVTLFGLRL